MTLTSPAVVLPADELSHHRVEYPEWWYFHGHLYAADGTLLASFEYTAIEIAGFYYAYAALMDMPTSSYLSDDRLFGDYTPNPSDHTFELNLDRTGTEPQNRWKIRSEANNPPEFSYHLFVLSAREKMRSWGLKLDLAHVKKPLLVGDQGRIPDGDDPSWLYSRTRLNASGIVQTDNGAMIPVTGSAWMDHQWGKPNPMSRRWRWFGIQMDGTEEEYLFMLVTDRNDESNVRLQHGYWIDGSGTAQTLVFSITARRDWNGWPIDNDISFDHPDLGLMILEVRADVDDQLRVPKPRLPTAFRQALEVSGILDVLTFWEGGCTVSIGGVEKGRAYTELGGF
jgi:predicted secreted hydrolase